MQLIAMGRGATGELIAHFTSPEFTIRWEIANILGSTRDPDAADALVDRILHDANSHVRWRSLWALSQVEAPGIGEAFLKALPAADGRLKMNAAVGCSMFGVKEALPVLYENLHSADAFTAWEAVNALSRIHEPSSVEHLEVTFDRADARLRRECVLSLGKMRYPAAWDLSIRALDDSDPGVRWRAAMVLADRSEDRAQAALERRRGIETDPEVIRHLDRSLKRIADKKARSQAR